jgi:hypothetical protein
VTGPGSAVTPSGNTRRTWLETRLLGGVGMKTRDAARTILRLVDDRPAADRVLIVEALHAIVDETERWKNAWASEHVDKDRKVREASARAMDCEAHGELIRSLESQVTLTAEAAQRAESGRLVMLGWYQSCVDFVAVARGNAAAHRPLPDLDAVLTWMETRLGRVSAAHRRVWAPSAVKARKAAVK